VTPSERNLKIASAIEEWFHRNGNDFPWRHSRDPYQVWVAAVMLQQTQIDTVTPYFNRFLAEFPLVTILAESSMDVVLKQWEGLGYYSRARNLHRAAQVVVDKYRGIIPSTFDELRSLPGVGDYTAATIASVAFREPVPVLDSVTTRLNLRLDNSRLNPASPKTHKSLLHRLNRRIEHANDPGIFNLGAMELGSRICQAKSPQCPLCPLSDYCKAFASGRPARIPRKRSKPAIPHYDIAAGLIWHDGRLLITRRPMDKMLGGLWEFPGGKQENGETLQQCLTREIREELGISIQVGKPFHSVKHAYSHFRITLHTFHCQLLNGEPCSIGVDDWNWVKPEQLSWYAFPRADIKIIEELKRQIESNGKSQTCERSHR
jgi:A/G-specific adenine glycosylase